MTVSALWLLAALFAADQETIKNPGQVLASFPADLATEVSTTPLVAVAVTPETTLRLSLDGQFLAEDKRGRTFKTFQLPQLPPNSTHSYTLEAWWTEQGEASAVVLGPYNFVTDDGLPKVAPTLAPATLTSTLTTLWDARAAADTCGRVLLGQYPSWSTPQMVWSTMTPKTTGQVSYFLIWQKGEQEHPTALPAHCPIQWISFCDGSDETDLDCASQAEVVAVDTAGTRSKTLVVEIPSMNEVDSEASGCAVAAGSPQLPGFLLPMVLLGLVLMRMRTPRRGPGSSLVR